MPIFRKIFKRKYFQNHNIGPRTWLFMTPEALFPEICHLKLCFRIIFAGVAEAAGLGRATSWARTTTAAGTWCSSGWPSVPFCDRSETDTFLSTGIQSQSFNENKESCRRIFLSCVPQFEGLKSSHIFWNCCRILFQLIFCRACCKTTFVF
jgi:hypothetical protein